MEKTLDIQNNQLTDHTMLTIVAKSKRGEELTVLKGVVCIPPGISAGMSAIEHSLHA